MEKTVKVVFHLEHGVQFFTLTVPSKAVEMRDATLSQPTRFTTVNSPTGGISFPNSRVVGIEVVPA